MSVWRKRQIYQSAATLNSHVYRQKLTIETVLELEEITKLMKKYNISVEGITQA
jgi:hypothetical protein